MRSLAHEPGFISLNVYYKEFARRGLRELSDHVLWCRIRRTTVKYSATTEACDRYVGTFWFWKELINWWIWSIGFTCEAVQRLLNLNLFTLFQPKRPKIIRIADGSTRPDELGQAKFNASCLASHSSSGIKTGTSNAFWSSECYGVSSDVLCPSLYQIN